MARRKESSVQAEVAQRADKVSKKAGRDTGSGKLCRTYLKDENWEQSNRKQLQLKGAVSPRWHRPSW